VLNYTWLLTRDFYGTGDFYITGNFSLQITVCVADECLYFRLAICTIGGFYVESALIPVRIDTGTKIDIHLIKET
jgi:hypothetical protein